MGVRSRLPGMESAVAGAAQRLQGASGEVGAFRGRGQGREVNDVNCDSLVLKFSIDDLDRPHSFLCDIHCIPFSP